MRFQSRLIQSTQIAFAVLTFLLFTQGTEAKSWWKDEWTIRKKITLDTSSAGAGISDPIGSSAVLVRLHDGNFRFTAAREDGSDIRFVAEDDKTLLPYHIEKYDGLLNEAFVWVRVPDVKPGAQTSFWLYYGNVSPSVARADDAAALYDSETVLVYHFAERNAAPQDATSNGIHAQGSAVNATGSFIGSGLRLDGRTAIIVPASPALAWAGTSAVTWAAWIKVTSLQPNAALFSRREGGSGFLIGADNGVPYVEVVSGGNAQRSPAGEPIAPNVWRHLAVVAAGPAVTLYLDGELYSTLSASLPALTGSSQLGSDGEVPVDGEGTGFRGEIDELQISKAARQIGFVKFAAIGQGAEKSAKLISLGNDEQTSSWMSEGYFGVIIKSLTFDGWIVICILVVMAAISWWVMIGKLAYLNGATRGNQLFMREWERISSDPSALANVESGSVASIGGEAGKAEQKAIRKAPIYRIYRIGAEQIQHRLALRPDEPKSLSTRAIQAVRARLDSGLVRETERLNNKIVLLTISISGGPFLGLLGTVVGVMITFAAVAAAGDVNVNAIAPGIAAALLATVAGLAVAIPALFGYNYLLSRIKATTNDMHVFIDEFVTSMAEHYRGQPAD